jgi:hypothetical protein
MKLRVGMATFIDILKDLLEERVAHKERVIDRKSITSDILRAISYDPYFYSGGGFYHFLWPRMEFPEGGTDEKARILRRLIDFSQPELFASPWLAAFEELGVPSSLWSEAVTLASASEALARLTLVQRLNLWGYTAAAAHIALRDALLELSKSFGPLTAALLGAYLEIPLAWNLRGRFFHLVLGTKYVMFEPKGDSMVPDFSHLRNTIIEKTLDALETTLNFFPDIVAKALGSYASVSDVIELLREPMKKSLEENLRFPEISIPSFERWATEVTPFYQPKAEIEKGNLVSPMLQDLAEKKAQGYPEEARARLFEKLPEIQRILNSLVAIAYSSWVKSLPENALATPLGGKLLEDIRPPLPFWHFRPIRFLASVTAAGQALSEWDARTLLPIRAELMIQEVLENTFDPTKEDPDLLIDDAMFSVACLIAGRADELVADWATKRAGWASPADIDDIRDYFAITALQYAADRIVEGALRGKPPKPEELAREAETFALNAVDEQYRSLRLPTDYMDTMLKKLTGIVFYGPSPIFVRHFSSLETERVLAYYVENHRSQLMAALNNIQRGLRYLESQSYNPDFSRSIRSQYVDRLSRALSIFKEDLINQPISFERTVESIGRLQRALITWGADPTYDIADAFDQILRSSLIPALVQDLIDEKQWIWSPLTGRAVRVPGRSIWEEIQKLTPQGRAHVLYRYQLDRFSQIFTEAAASLSLEFGALPWSTSDLQTPGQKILGTFIYQNAIQSLLPVSSFSGDLLSSLTAYQKNVVNTAVQELLERPEIREIVEEIDGKYQNIREVPLSDWNEAWERLSEHSSAILEVTLDVATRTATNLARYGVPDPSFMAKRPTVTDVPFHEISKEDFAKLQEVLLKIYKTLGKGNIPEGQRKFMSAVATLGVKWDPDLNNARGFLEARDVLARTYENFFLEVLYKIYGPSILVEGGELPAPLEEIAAMTAFLSGKALGPWIEISLDRDAFPEVTTRLLEDKTPLVPKRISGPGLEGLDRFNLWLKNPRNPLPKSLTPDGLKGIQETLARLYTAAFFMIADLMPMDILGLQKVKFWMDAAEWARDFVTQDVLPYVIGRFESGADLETIEFEIKRFMPNLITREWSKRLPAYEGLPSKEDLALIEEEIRFAPHMLIKGLDLQSVVGSFLRSLERRIREDPHALVDHLLSNENFLKVASALVREDPAYSVELNPAVLGAKIIEDLRNPHSKLFQFLMDPKRATSFLVRTSPSISEVPKFLDALEKEYISSSILLFYGQFAPRVPGVPTGLIPVEAEARVVTSEELREYANQLEALLYPSEEKANEILRKGYEALVESLGVAFQHPAVRDAIFGEEVRFRRAFKNLRFGEAYVSKISQLIFNLREIATFMEREPEAFQDYPVVTALLSVDPETTAGVIAVKNLLLSPFRIEEIFTRESLPSLFASIKPRDLLASRNRLLVTNPEVLSSLSSLRPIFEQAMEQEVQNSDLSVGLGWKEIFTDSERELIWQYFGTFISEAPWLLPHCESPDSLVYKEFAKRFWPLIRLKTAERPERSEFIRAVSKSLEELPFDLPKAQLISLFQEGKISINPDEVWEVVLDQASNFLIRTSLLLSSLVPHDQLPDYLDYLGKQVEFLAREVWFPYAAALKVAGKEVLGHLQDKIQTDIFGPNMYSALELATLARRRPPESEPVHYLLGFEAQSDVDILKAVARWSPAFQGFLMELGGIFYFDNPDAIAEAVSASPQGKEFVEAIREVIEERISRFEEFESFFGSELLNKTFSVQELFHSIVKEAAVRIGQIKLAEIYVSLGEAQEAPSRPLGGRAAFPAALEKMNLTDQQREALSAYLSYLKDNVRTSDLLSAPDSPSLLLKETMSDPHSEKVFNLLSDALTSTSDAEIFAQALYQRGYISMETLQKLREGDFEGFMQDFRKSLQESPTLKKLYEYWADRMRQYAFTLARSLLIYKLYPEFAERIAVPEKPSEIHGTFMETWDDILPTFLVRNFTYILLASQPSPETGQMDLPKSGFFVNPRVLYTSPEQAWNLMVRKLKGFQLLPDFEPVPSLRLYVYIGSPMTQGLLKSQFLSALFGGPFVKVGNAKVNLRTGGLIYQASKGLASNELKELFQRKASTLARKVFEETIEELLREYPDGWVEVNELVSRLDRKIADLAVEFESLKYQLMSGLPPSSTIAERLQNTTDPLEFAFLSYLVQQGLYYPDQPPPEIQDRAVVEAWRALGLVIAPKDFVYQLYQLGEQIWEVGKYPLLVSKPNWEQRRFTRETQRGLGEFWIGTVERMFPLDTETMRQNRPLIEKISETIGDKRLLDWLDLGIWLKENNVYALPHSQEEKDRLARAFTAFFDNNKEKIFGNDYYLRTFLLWDRIYRFGEGGKSWDVVEANRRMEQVLRVYVPIAKNVEIRKPGGRTRMTSILTWDELEEIWRSEIEPMIRAKTDEKKKLMNLLYYWGTFLHPVKTWITHYLRPRSDLPYGVNTSIWLERVQRVHNAILQLLPLPEAKPHSVFGSILEKIIPGISRAWEWVKRAFAEGTGLISYDEVLAREYERFSVPVVGVYGDQD